MNKTILNRYDANDPLCSKCFVVSHFDQGNDVAYVAINHLIVFLIKGTICISLERNASTVLEAPVVFLIPKGVFYERQALSAADFIILPFRNHLEISYMPIKEYASANQNNTVVSQIVSYAPLVLRVNPILIKYLDLLVESNNIGFHEEEFFEIKIKELMLIWERLYSYSDRLQFFGPVVNSECSFSDFIYNNYKKVKTVQELACLSCYSLSGFEKKFRRVFGISPSKWLKQQMSVAVYHEITKTSKPFKEISMDLGFSSTSHLNNFCKEAIGQTPGEIRKKHANKIDLK